MVVSSRKPHRSLRNQCLTKITVIWLIFMLVIFVAFSSTWLLISDKFSMQFRAIWGTKTIAGDYLEPTPWHRFHSKTFSSSGYARASQISQCAPNLTCTSRPGSTHSGMGNNMLLENTSNSCPAFFQWIYEDLAPWSTTGITQDSIRDAKDNAAFRVVIVGGRLYVDLYYACVQSRMMFTIWGLVQLLERYPGLVPDVDLMFECMDIPRIERSKYSRSRSPPPPLFRYCSNTDHFDIPFPDWSFWGWPEVNLGPWEEEFNSIKLGSKAVKWIERKPTAYWKGNPYVNSPTRTDLLKCNSSRTWGAEILPQNWIEEANAGYEQSKLSNQCGSRYKIYTEGFTWSVSFKYILSCDSPVLVATPEYYDFFTRGLMPRENYWPVRSKKLCPSVKFAVDWGNNHPAEAEAIGKGGQKFMEELKMDNVYDYMFHLLSEYSKLLKFRPEVPVTAQEVCRNSILCLAEPKERVTLERSIPKTTRHPQPCSLDPPNRGLIKWWMTKKTKVINDIEKMEDMPQTKKMEAEPEDKKMEVESEDKKMENMSQTKKMEAEPEDMKMENMSQTKKMEAEREDKKMENMPQVEKVEDKNQNNKNGDISQRKEKGSPWSEKTQAVPQGKVEDKQLSAISDTKTIAGDNLEPTPWHPFPPKIFSSSGYVRASQIFQCSSNLTCTSPPELIRSDMGNNMVLQNTSHSCPAFFQWIYEDLAPWSTTGITPDTIKAAKDFAAFRVVIMGGRLYVDLYYACVQSRMMFTIWGLLQLLERYPGLVPDVDLMFDCMDRPKIERSKYRGSSSPPPPLFRYCSNRYHFDIPFPDWSFWGWPEVNLAPWEEEFSTIKLGSKAVKWVERKPTAYWKGNPDVGSPIRAELLKCNSSTKWGAEILRQNWVAEANAGYEESKLSNQCRSRYKIYTEGHAWSVSFKYILSCDSPVLVATPEYYDFFTRGLTPRENYWPVRSKKLCPSVKFAVDWGNNHVAEAEAIGKGGQKFMEELNMDNVFDYMFHLLSEYSKLQKFRPEVPATAQEVCQKSVLCLAEPTERIALETSIPKTTRHPQPCSLDPSNSRLIRRWIAKKANVINDIEKMEDMSQTKKMEAKPEGNIENMSQMKNLPQGEKADKNQNNKNDDISEREMKEGISRSKKTHKRKTGNQDTTQQKF